MRWTGLHGSDLIGPGSRANVLERRFSAAIGKSTVYFAQMPQSNGQTWVVPSTLLTPPSRTEFPMGDANTPHPCHEAAWFPLSGQKVALHSTIWPWPLAGVENVTNLHGSMCNSHTRPELRGR